MVDEHINEDLSCVGSFAKVGLCLFYSSRSRSYTSQGQCFVHQ